MNEDDLILLEQYLRGELPPAEVQKLETRLNKEPDLQADLTLLRKQNQYLAYRAGGGLSIEDLETMAKDARTDRPEEIKSRKASSGRILRIFIPAAVAATFLLFMWWQPWDSADLTPEELYAVHMTQPVWDVTTRNSDSTDPELTNSDKVVLSIRPNLLQQAAQAYETEDYQTVASLLERYSQTDAPNSEVLLIYAVSLIEIGDFSTAMQSLETLAESGSLLASEAPFYQCLALIKQGKIEEAKTLIRQTPKGDTKLERLREDLN
ncbi:MAG: hypothetical protein AAGF87_05895 [Bacteroidota bacterium]